eukprot:330745_1
MMDKLYSFIHQLSHIGTRNNDKINLCFLKHTNYLEMNEQQKYKYIYKLVYNRKHMNMYKLNFQTGIKITYTISWIIAYLYPIIWLSFYLGLNNKTSIWNLYEVAKLT